MRTTIVLYKFNHSSDFVMAFMFYIVILKLGICVSGHYVPQLSQSIVRYNQASKEKAINLQGYMV